MSTSTLFVDEQLLPPLTVQSKKQSHSDLQAMMKQAWSKLAPFWPLKEFVAVNPLKGFVDQPIEEALIDAEAFFQQENMPEGMCAVNRETIKWCQAFFDEGQAIITMPNRELGLFNCWKKLAVWDPHLHGNDESNVRILKNLSEDPQKVISKFLSILNISPVDQELFLTLVLTTLPGWASHVKYRDESQHEYHPFTYKASQSDYLAMRLVIMGMLWPAAADLVAWHKMNTKKIARNSQFVHLIEKSENEYHTPLLEALSAHAYGDNNEKGSSDAQFVFCIDVRSDPIRKSIESQGKYETYGYAGFFGLPVAFEDAMDQQIRPSCPVIVKSEHVLKLDSESSNWSHNTVKQLKGIIHRLKYNFTTSLALVELLGAPAGLWMTVQNFFPGCSSKIKERVTKPGKHREDLSTHHMTIPFQDQCLYAETILRTMGLTHTFAPLVIFCGHGSSTENNAYSSSLDCGACGGRSGIGNAKVICQILNCPNVRSYLQAKEISIGNETLFIAGEHNTTTNEIRLITPRDISESSREKIQALKKHLDVSKDLCNAGRIEASGSKTCSSLATKKAVFKSSDWAQTRPEWGLAKNAAFIVGPRSLTKNIDLQGRSFLQSYDWRQDSEGSLLAGIMKGPMNVAHWINSQYLFSSLDNVAYGSGSKVTKNITGKIGIIQGNGSDLMHGLPLQSVNQCDRTIYHSPCRLMSVIFAPKKHVENIIHNEPEIKTLIENGWIRLFCMDPLDQKTYRFNDLKGEYR